MRGIGSDGSVRSHLMSAVMHLLLANDPPDVTSFADHAIAIVDQLQNMVARTTKKSTPTSRATTKWSDVIGYLPDNMIDWAHWLLDHPAALKSKTIRLIEEDRPDDRRPDDERGDLRPRDPHHRACAHRRQQAVYGDGGHPVRLLVAPTGSRKSTLMRAAAVRYVRSIPARAW